MDTKEELNRVTDIVEDILKKDIRARNDDKYLTFLVIRRFTNIYINFEDFSKIPAFESIKRIRANFQNKKNMYVPTDEEVIKKRQKRQNIFKEVFK